MSSDIFSKESSIAEKSSFRGLGISPQTKGRGNKSRPNMIKSFLKGKPYPMQKTMLKPENNPLRVSDKERVAKEGFKGISVIPGEEADLARAGFQAEERPRLALKPETPVLRLKEKLPSDFNKMWEAHPHNYQDDESQNTSSKEILEQIGLPKDWNTCAIRLSVMLNKLGLKITPAKVKAAGIARRPYYSKKTKEYYIISAKEMWTYLTKNFRKPDRVFPAAGKSYKNSEEFDKGFESEIKPIVESRKGIVAFEKIFGYSGTGHVDLFDGLKLSDAPSWYPSMRLQLWYVEVPDTGGVP